jgi:hypothetical protein
VGGKTTKQLYLLSELWALGEAVADEGSGARCFWSAEVEGMRVVITIVVVRRSWDGYLEGGWSNVRSDGVEEDVWVRLR